MMGLILQWATLINDTVQRDFDKATTGLTPQQGGPTRASRAYAIVYLAMHDAYFGISAAHPTYLALAGGIMPPVPAGAMPQGALCAAALNALTRLYPGFAVWLKSRADDIHSTLGMQPTPGMMAFGDAIVDALFVLRAGDAKHSNDFSENLKDFDRTGLPPATISPHAADPFAPKQGYQTPYWGRLAPFTTSTTVPNGRVALAAFPAYGTDDYIVDHEEVRRLGAFASSDRSVDETATGIYWSYDGSNKLGVPPRLYNQTAIAALKALPVALSEADLLRRLTLVNVAMAEAAIDAWYWKMSYYLWRPVVGIRHAAPAAQNGAGSGALWATETGLATPAATPVKLVGDPLWAPLGAQSTNPVSPPVGNQLYLTPNFASYPSGHATFGAALFQILEIARTTAIGAATPLTISDVTNAGADIEANRPVAAVAPFDFVSDEFNGVAVDPQGSVRTHLTKRFPTYASAIYDNAISRVYLGVHWRFDGLPRQGDEAKGYGGVPLGLGVGQKVWDFFNGNAGPNPTANLPGR